jgi:hypothetical protein
MTHYSYDTKSHWSDSYTDIPQNGGLFAMNIQEIRKMMKVAGRADEPLYFAFGIADNEGVLVLHRQRKGKAILHDLVNEEGNRELESRRFGTVSYSSETSIATFIPDKKFDSRGLGSPTKLMERARFEVSQQVEAGEEGGGEDLI